MEHISGHDKYLDPPDDAPEVCSACHRDFDPSDAAELLGKTYCPDCFEEKISNLEALDKNHPGNYFIGKMMIDRSNMIPGKVLVTFHENGVPMATLHWKSGSNTPDAYYTVPFDHLEPIPDRDPMRELLVCPKCGYVVARGLVAAMKFDYGCPHDSVPFTEFKDLEPKIDPQYDPEDDGKVNDEGAK